MIYVWDRIRTRMHTNNINISSKIADSFFFVRKNYVVPRDSSYRYVRYRILRPILKGYYKLFNLFNPGRPWTSQASIKIFDNILGKGQTGLEYGSGRSTVYFAARLGKLISIEHYRDWYDRVSQMLQEKGIDNVDYYFIPKTDLIDVNDNNESYLQRYSGDETRPEYEDYANKVLEFEDDFF